jgi:predicted kinase
MMNTYLISIYNAKGNALGKIFLAVENLLLWSRCTIMTIMNKPKLIIISGLPGSGKSTIAEAVAKKLKLPIFSVDPIESAIIKSGIPKSFETGLAAYVVAQTLCAEHLKIGIPVIIDAVSPVKEARDMWHELEEKYNVQLIIVECVLKEDLHRKRIESRTRNIPGIPEVTWADVEHRQKDYLPWKEERLVLDTENIHEKNLEKVLDYISQCAKLMKDK